MEVNNINCGIYRIKNLINKKVYIGLSKNIARRWEEHKIELNNNKKTSNYHFQGAWTLYGEENFNFLILENCDEKNLPEREILWSTTYNSTNPLYGYNIHQCGYGGAFYGKSNGMYGKSHSDKNRRIKSDINKKSKWINKNGTRKFVLYSNIDFYLQEGWTLGKGKEKSKNKGKLNWNYLKIDKETTEIIIEKYKNNIHTYDIFLQTGVKPGKIKNILIENNIDLRKEERWCKGKTLEQICKNEQKALMIRERYKMQIKESGSRKGENNPRFIKIDNDLEEKIIDFYKNNNFSKVYVSIKFKVPGSVLNRILKQHSIETKKYKKPKNDEYFKNKLEKKRINNNEQLSR